MHGFKVGVPAEEEVGEGGKRSGENFGDFFIAIVFVTKMRFFNFVNIINFFSMLDQS